MPCVTITNRDQLQKVELDSNIAIRCSVNTKDFHSLTWEVSTDDERWVDVTNNTSKYHGGTKDNPTLMIYNIRNEDFGTYRCTVTSYRLPFSDRVVVKTVTNGGYIEICFKGLCCFKVYLSESSDIAMSF